MQTRSYPAGSGSSSRNSPQQDGQVVAPGHPERGPPQQLAELSLQHGIAASYDNKLIVDAGGIMSYGPDSVDMFSGPPCLLTRSSEARNPLTCPLNSQLNSKWPLT